MDEHRRQPPVAELTPALEIAQRPSYPEVARRRDASGNLASWELTDSRCYYELVAELLRSYLAAEGELARAPRAETRFYATRENDWSDLFALRKRDRRAHPPPPPPVVPADAPLAAADHLLRTTPGDAAAARDHREESASSSRDEP